MTTDLINKFDIISKQLELSSFFAMNNDTCLLVRLCTVVAGNALVSEMNKVKDLALNGIVSQKFLIDEFQDDVADITGQNVSVYEELRKQYTEINEITSKICDCTDALIDDVKLMKNIPHLLPSMKDYTQDVQESAIMSRIAKVDCDSIGDSANNNITAVKANLLPLEALDKFKPDGCCSPNLQKENLLTTENLEHITKSPTEPLSLDDVVRSETTVLHLQIETKPTDNICKENCRAQLSCSSTTQVAEPPVLLLHEPPRKISAFLARTSSSFDTVTLQNYSLPLEGYRYNSMGKKDNKVGSNIDEIAEACIKIFTDDEDLSEKQSKTSSMLTPTIVAENKLSRSRTASNYSSMNRDVRKETKDVSLISKSSQHNSDDFANISIVSNKVQLSDKIVQSKFDTNTGKKISKKMVPNVRKRTYTVSKKFNSLPRKVQTIAKPAQTTNKRTFPKNPIPDAIRFQPKNKKCRLELRNNHINEEDPRLAALPLHPSCYKPFVEIQKETVSTTCSDIELYSKTVTVLATNSTDILSKPNVTEVIKTDTGTDPISEIESDFGTASKEFETNVSQNLVNRGTDCCLFDTHQPTKIYVDTCTAPCKSVIQASCLKQRLRTLGTQTIFPDENIARNPEDKVQVLQQDMKKNHKHKVEKLDLPKPKLPYHDLCVQKNKPKCGSTDLTDDGLFQVIKCPVVYEKSRKTERVIVKAADPNEFAEVRPNVTSAEMEKLIAEAMTDSVDFSDREQFIEFRRKVVNAKNGRCTERPRIYVFRWLEGPTEHPDDRSQSYPYSSMVPSYYSKKKDHAMKIATSVKESPKNNNLTKSRRYEYDVHARSLIAERNVTPRKELAKEKAVVYPHNIYSREGAGRVEGGYVYKSPKICLTPTDVPDISEFSDFINSGRSGSIVNKTTEFSTGSISLNPVRKFANTYFIPSVKETSENKLSKLGDLLKIPPKPEMNILMNRNIYDQRSFNINQKRIIESYPVARKLN